MRIEGTSALVAGGASGLGEANARALAAAGAPGRIGPSDAALRGLRRIAAAAGLTAPQ